MAPTITIAITKTTQTQTQTRTILVLSILRGIGVHGGPHPTASVENQRHGQQLNQKG